MKSRTCSQRGIGPWRTRRARLACFTVVILSFLHVCSQEAKPFEVSIPFKDWMASRGSFRSKVRARERERGAWDTRQADLGSCRNDERTQSRA
eukprot:546391-Pleurochrysis_carterae.AAC.1